MKVTNVSKFTLAVYKFVTPAVLQALEQAGISDYIFQQGKGVSLSEAHWFFGNQVVENSLDTFHFICQPEREEQLFNELRQATGINQEGRGSIFVEPALVIESSESDDNFEVLERRLHMPECQLRGIYAIIQRGRGMNLAKQAINNGSGVPAFYYGKGGGIRDRMGLVRITVPCEKEMINVVVAEHDCQGMMDELIDAGHLNRPGMGFIFSYPVTRADMDTQSYYGASRAAASMGQVVSAIDALQGSTEWRRRTLLGDSEAERPYLHDLENIMIICNDTKANDLLHIAMGVGAPGATISNCRMVHRDDLEGVTKRAIEISDMVVGCKVRPTILKALIEAGFFSSDIGGKIIIKRSCEAYTYIERR